MVLNNEIQKNEAMFYNVVFFLFIIYFISTFPGQAEQPQNILSMTCWKFHKQKEIILYKYYLAYNSTLHLRVLLGQFLSLLDYLFNGSHHVESLLGQGIIFTFEIEKG